MISLDRSSEASLKEGLGRIIEQELSNADGADGDELRAHQQAAMHYYNCEAPGAGEADESKAVSADLRDMVTAILAQLTPMISSDALVSFEPRGSEDEDAARMEATACNRMIMDHNSGFTKLQACIKDASLARNTFAKVWAEMAEAVEIRELLLPEETTVDQLLAVLSEAQGVEAEEIEDPDLEDGVVKVKLTRRTRRFRWRPVDPRRFLYAQAWNEHDLQGIRFCAEAMLKSRSDLKEEGYDGAMVDDLPTSDLLTEHGAERAQDRDVTLLQDQAQTSDQELVTIHECYLLCDLDGDGISERLKVVVADRRLVLDYEVVEMVPYAVGSIMIRANRMQGEDLFDHLQQTQDIKTGLIRRWLDNTRAATYARFVGQRNNLDETAEDARSGQVMWCTGSAQQAVQVMPVIDVGPSIEAALNYQDRARAEAGGASLDMQTSSNNIAGETWRGINEQYTVKEMLAAMFAKNLCETLIRSLYLMFHRMLRTQAVHPIGVRMRDQWREVTPTEWPQRDEITVLPGLTARARAAQVQALSMGLQFSQAVVQQGLDGQLVDPDSLYATVTDLYRCAGIESPEQYFVDPSSTKAQQNAQRKQQQQQEQMRIQIEMMRMQLRSIELEHEVAARNKSIDARVDLYKADADNVTRLAETLIKEEGNAEQRAVEAVDRARDALAGAGAAGDPNSAVGNAD